MNNNNYKRLGDFIEAVNIRNIDNIYGANELRGVNNEGNIIQSKANIIGVEFNTYKIAHNGYFIYNPARLDIGSLSCLQEDTAIFSQMYVVFKVKDECTNVLLSDFLWLWLKRKDFYRYVAFVNFGSVREMFTYEDMCNVMLPVPSIEEQRRIVAEYQTVERRIKNNEALIQKLEETAQAIYHNTFVEGIDENNLPKGWRMGCLGEVCEFAYGKMPDENKFVESGYPVFCGYAITKYYSEYSYDKPTIVIIARGDAGSGEVHISPDRFFLSNLGIAIMPKDYRYNNYLLFHLQSVDTYSLRTGTAQAQITINNLVPFGIIVPPVKLCEEYNAKIDVLRKNQKLIEQELTHLRKLQSLLTSKLA